MFGSHLLPIRIKVCEGRNTLMNIASDINNRFINFTGMGKLPSVSSIDDMI